MRSTITSTTGTINALIEHRRGDQGPRLEPRQLILPQVREHASSAETEQGNRNRQKREVVKQHDGKQPGQRQFKQQRGKAAKRHAEEHRAIRGLVCVGNWGQEGCLAHCERFARNAASLTEQGGQLLLSIL